MFLSFGNHTTYILWYEGHNPPAAQREGIFPIREKFYKCNMIKLFFSRWLTCSLLLCMLKILPVNRIQGTSFLSDENTNWVSPFYIETIERTLLINLINFSPVISGTTWRRSKMKLQLYITFLRTENININMK